MGVGCREGNGWSHQYCRRQWSLVDSEHLRYRYMNAWDAAMQRLDQEYGFLSSQHLLVSCSDDKEQVGASLPCGRASVSPLALHGGACGRKYRQ